MLNKSPSPPHRPWISSSIVRTASAMCFAIGGGTALATCRCCSPTLPWNPKSFGNPCRRAISRTDRLRSSWGWMWGWPLFAVIVYAGLSGHSRWAHPVKFS